MFLVPLSGWKLFADRDTVPLPLAALVKKFEGFENGNCTCMSQGQGWLKGRWAVALCCFIGARSHSNSPVGRFRDDARSCECDEHRRYLPPGGMTNCAFRESAPQRGLICLVRAWYVPASFQEDTSFSSP